jgi:hypothetical protein
MPALQKQDGLWYLSRETSTDAAVADGDAAVVLSVDADHQQRAEHG